MSSKDDEVSILEIGASQGRNLRVVGLLALTNKQLRFQPNKHYNTLTYRMVLVIVLTVIFLGVLCALFTVVVHAGVVGLSITGIIFLLAIGLLITGRKYHKRASKEVIMELKNIVDVSETGRSNQLWVKLGDGQVGRFNIQGEEASAILDDVKFALQGDLATTENRPSSLVVTEELNVPQYSVPLKYPGAVVPLQKTYLTPKICCMCGEPAREKTITAKPIAHLKMSDSVYSARMRASIHTPFTYPFPICDYCLRGHRWAKISGSLGGIIGLVIGVVVFALLFLSNHTLLITIFAFLASVVGYFVGLSNVTTNLFFFFLISLTAALFALFGWVVGWGIAKASGVSFALRHVPKERKAFYNVVADDKGIRVLRRPGFVAFGFLSKEFATVFQQMNRGVATVVGASAKENEQIGKAK